MKTQLTLLLFLIVTISSSLAVNNFRGYSPNQRSFIQRATPTTTYNPNIPLGSSGGFTGFNDAFKNQMASLLAEVTNAKTPETIMLKNKLMIGLISIDNTLSMISKSRQKEAELKPLLQYQVKNFLSDLDVVQEQLSRINGSVVLGNNNYAGGKVGIINGNNDAVFGQQNLVLGDNNLLQGNRSIISGSGNGVRGNNGVTVGNGNRVDADSAFVFTNNDVVMRDNTLTVRDSTIDLGRLIGGGRGGYITRT